MFKTTMRYHLTNMRTKTLHVTNDGEDIEKGNPSTLMGESMMGKPLRNLV